MDGEEPTGVVSIAPENFGFDLKMMVMAVMKTVQLAAWINFFLLVFLLFYPSIDHFICSEYS